MDNFFFGMQSALISVTNLVHAIAAYSLFWGFALGFLVSTIFHAFLIADTPKGVPMMMFGDKAVAFDKLYPREQNDNYRKSFADFSKNVDKMKFIFSIASIVTVVLLLIFLITIS